MLSLNYRKYGSGPPLLILHGLFGSSDNWHSLAKRWSETFTVYAIDQRNHGLSPHESIMNYAELASDLSTFIRRHRLKDVNLLGHSMGGKTAMTFAVQEPESVKSMIILDIGIGQTKGQHEAILNALNALEPAAFGSRQDIEEALSEFVAMPAIRQFLLKNVLRRADGSFSWKFNRDALLDNYESLISELSLDGMYHGPVLFLRGANSPYLEPELDPEILQFFPSALLESVQNAGHWLHAEQPEHVFARVSKWFKPD